MSMERPMMIADAASLRRRSGADLMMFIGEGPPPVTYRRQGRLGVLRIDGPVGVWYGATSEAVARVMREAREDKEAAEVLLDINCPGGDVLGASDIIDETAKLAAAKPMYAIAHDDCCSLAYWAACHAIELVATPTARVGSVGAASMVLDDSERMKREGMRFLHIQSGDLKQIGAPGQQVTEAQETHLREYIMGYADDFAAAVMVRRGMSREDIAGMRGAYFKADAGLARKLIDRVVTFADYLAEREASAGKAGALTVPTQTPRKAAAAVAHGESSMSTAPAVAATVSVTASTDYDQQTDAELAEAEAKIAAAKAKRAPAPEPKAPEANAPAPATHAELAAAIPDKAFAFSCLEGGMTLVQAQGAYIKHLGESKPAARPAAAPGAAAVPQYGAMPEAANPNAPKSYEAAVLALAAEKGIPVTKAAWLCAKNPAMAGVYADWKSRGFPYIKAA